MSERPEDTGKQTGEKQAAQHEAHPLRRVNLQNFQSLIDQHMREAEAAGQFRNLPGAGKPLKLDDDSLVPEDMRLANRLLKGSGFAPPWIELQKSIREDQEQLAAWLARENRRWPGLGEADRTRLREEYSQKTRELNRQITNYNLTAPPVAGQIPLLQPWRELRKLGAE